MKLLFSVAHVAAAMLLVPQPVPAPALPTLARTPVAVELFTSEGCSSCPSADALLLELARSQPVAGVEVVALSQHVDYWNRLGWRDPFSSPVFTHRQQTYAAALGVGSYTPQAVINGRYELVGSQRPALLAALAEAARVPHATVQVSPATMGGAAALRVTVAQVPEAATEPAEVLLAFTETGLSSVVGRGENAGRTLRHAAVVRELRVLGRVAADGHFAATPALALNSQWRQANLRAVVLVQQVRSRRLVGVGTLALAR